MGGGVITSVPLRARPSLGGWGENQRTVPPQVEGALPVLLSCLDDDNVETRGLSCEVHTLTYYGHTLTYYGRTLTYYGDTLLSTVGATAPPATLTMAAPAVRHYVNGAGVYMRPTRCSAM